MKKAIIVSIITIFSIIVIVVSTIVILHNFNFNIVSIDIAPDLNKNDFRIEYNVTSLTDDYSVIYKNKTIYDGSNTFQIPEEYGENDFQLIYKDSLYACFRHLKLNSNSDHIYKFQFYKESNKIKCKVSIIGKYNKKTVLTLNKLEYQYVGDRVIEIVPY